MSDFALYFHGGSKNRGCEAIVRSTAVMLKDYYNNSTVGLYSLEPEQDAAVGLDDIDALNAVSFDKGSLVKPFTFLDTLKIKMYSRSSASLADEYYYSRFYKELPLEGDSLFLSVGGDNYCYGENSWMNAMNLQLKALGKRTVLWGCSLDDDSFSPYNMRDLRTYDAIFARETLTFKSLQDRGFENAQLFTDPAFTLEKQELPLPDGFYEGESIGVNISPLILKYENAGRKGIGMRAYEKLIDYIINHTSYNVVLIPHVFTSGGNDLEPLMQLYSGFSQKKRVVLLDDEKLTAGQLKGYIARCHAFVGARTHATIAAYSSCIPTLVLGYSIKSKGIAKDIFGSDEGLVLPVGELDDENALTNAMRGILDNSDSLVATLKEVMPGYIQSAYDAARALEPFI